MWWNDAIFEALAPSSCHVVLDRNVNPAIPASPLIASIDLASVLAWVEVGL